MLRLVSAAARWAARCLLLRKCAARLLCAYVALQQVHVHIRTGLTSASVGAFSARYRSLSEVESCRVMAFMQKVRRGASSFPHKLDEAEHALRGG